MGYYKLFTHDFRPPVQGGEPVWNGTYPFTLPTVRLDTSRADCAPGWHFSASLAHALKLVGFWPNGRPSLAVVVEPSEDAIKRGDKWRASSLTLVRPASEAEVSAAIDEFSAVFVPHAEYMANEQRAWRFALDRPRRDAAAVERALAAALKGRGLDWGLKRYGAAWDARAAWDVRAAWAALTVAFASVNGWINQPRDLLTHGLRDAYTEGLEIAIPTEPNTLGWVMAA